MPNSQFALLFLSFLLPSPRAGPIRKKSGEKGIVTGSPYGLRLIANGTQRLQS